MTKQERLDYYRAMSLANQLEFMEEMMVLECAIEEENKPKAVIVPMKKIRSAKKTKKFSKAMSKGVYCFKGEQ